MAKRRPPKGQINKRNNQCIQALRNLMEDLGEKYSIRVGIIGQQAAQKHRDTDLTNAELGAIHEFGASMIPTEKQKGYFWHRWGIQKSNKQINIPTRSFLRVPLLSKQGKERILDKVTLSVKDRELNKAIGEIGKASNKNFLKELCEVVGMEAYYLVIDTFELGGFPERWQPTSEWSKQNRKYNPANPTLIDSGDLRKSISYEVKESN